MHTPIINNICLSANHEWQAGRGRRGTAFLSLEDFGHKFGNPHAQDFSEAALDGAGKVHAVWSIDTPRGKVEISDYWWNAKDELSIRAETKKAALWVVSWLKIHGIPAKLGMPEL